ncbi:MAG: glycine zipper 2TM domain-containing protein [Novosphingobium sp.]
MTTTTMTVRKITLAAAAAATMALGVASPVEARACKRLNKTEGAIIGAVGGGILGNIIGGRGNHTTGTLVGAAAGGVAGHEIARTKYNKHCRRYYRR